MPQTVTSGTCCFLQNVRICTSLQHLVNFPGPGIYGTLSITADQSFRNIESCSRLSGWPDDHSSGMRPQGNADDIVLEVKNQLSIRLLVDSPIAPSHRGTGVHTSN